MNLPAGYQLVHNDVMKEFKDKADNFNALVELLQDSKVSTQQVGNVIVAEFEFFEGEYARLLEWLK